MRRDDGGLAFLQRTSTFRECKGAGGRGAANQRRPRPSLHESEPSGRGAATTAAGVGGDGVGRGLCWPPGLRAALPAGAPRPAVSG